MDNLNDINYYVGKIEIPNLEKLPDFENAYMNRYQKEYLIKVLGYAMFRDFETALAGTADQKWLDLRDGVDYNVTIDGVDTLTHWNGFKNTEKVSPISFYTYVKFLNQNYATLTGNGVVVNAKENATNHPPVFKTTSAQNEEIDLTGNLRSYLCDSDYKYIKKYKNNKYYREDLNFIDDSMKLDESLFMYLYHHRDDFGNWIFTNETKQNVFGI